MVSIRHHELEQKIKDLHNEHWGNIKVSIYIAIACLLLPLFVFTNIDPKLLSGFPNLIALIATISNLSFIMGLAVLLTACSGNPHQKEIKRCEDQIKLNESIKMK